MEQLLTLLTQLKEKADDLFDKFPEPLKSGNKPSKTIIDYLFALKKYKELITDTQEKISEDKLLFLIKQFEKSEPLI